MTLDRLPSHMKRYSGLYTFGVFLLSSFIGISSYRKTCLERIMALDNSRLADRIREYTEG